MTKLIFYPLYPFIEILNSPGKHPKLRNKTRQIPNRTKRLTVSKAWRAGGRFQTKMPGAAWEERSDWKEGDLRCSANDGDCKSVMPTEEQRG